MFFTKSQIITAQLLTIIPLAGGTGLWLARSAPTKLVEPANPVNQERAHTDLRGDPLPVGAITRLGTTRLRLDNFDPNGMAFFPDANTLVTASATDHALQLWETHTGKLIREISFSPISIRTFVLSPDGKLVAVAGSLPFEGSQPTPGVIRFFDSANGKETRTISRDAGDIWDASFAFTPDSKYLISLSRQGVLRVEEVVTGVELLRHQFPGGLKGKLAISADGQLIAVAPGVNTQKLYVWSWQTPVEPREFPAPPYGAAALCFSPDGKMLATYGDHDGTVRLWDVASTRLLRSISAPDDAATAGAMVFSKDGRILMTADWGNNGKRNGSGAVFLWDLAAGKVTRRLETPGESLHALAISLDGRWIAAASSSAAHVWELPTGKELAPTNDGHHDSICRVAVSATGLIATASYDHCIRVWSGASGRQRAKLDHQSYVLDVNFSADGKLLASTSLDDSVRIWDADTGREIYKLAGHGGLGSVKRTIKFTPDSRRLLSWGDDYYLRVWDTKTGKALIEHAIRPGGIMVSDDNEDEQAMRQRVSLSEYEAMFTPDGATLVFVSNRGFYVFDVATGKELRKFKETIRHITSMAISLDSRYLLTSSWGEPVLTKLPDGSMRSSLSKVQPICLWELSSGKLLRKIMLPATIMTQPVAFSPDGKVFAVGVDDPHGQIRLFETISGKHLRTVEGFKSRATALAFSADGKHLISAMKDTSALIWDLTRQENQR